MHDDKPNQFVDELLEASLKQYRGEEPRSGLEMRILAGVRSRQCATRRRGLVWAVAACAAVLATVVLTLHFLRAPLPQRTPSATLRSQEPAYRAPQQGAAPPATISQLQPGLRRRGSGGLAAGHMEKPRTPKPGVRVAKRLEQFPTPMALTEQEKLLSAYLSQGSKPYLLAKDDKEGAPITELEISTIQIAPLEIKPLDDSQSERGM